MAHLESCVRAALEQVPSYRLVSAAPDQVQEFFYLLEAYAHDLGRHPVQTRQRLAQQALLLCKSLAPPVVS